MRGTGARPLVVLALAALIGSVAVVAAWMIDGRAHRGKVLPHAVVAGKQVRGLGEADVARWVADVGARYAEATVDVQTEGGGGFRATVPELGVAVDERDTVARVMAEGRRDSLPTRFWVWARSWLSPVTLPVTIQVDQPKMDRVVAARDRGRIPPTEPGLAVKDGHLDGVAGKNGRGVDPAELAGALRRTPPAAGTLLVTMDPSSIPPRFTKADADHLAAEGDKVASGGLEVTAGGETAAVPADSLRAWLRAVPTDEALRLGIRHDDSVLGGLAELLAGAGTKPVNAGFTVSGGRVSITPSKTGTACCAPEALDALDAAVSDPAKRAAPVALPLRTVTAERDEEAARKLGIVEQVSTFTTPHAAGEPRVQNIHRMADTIRGTVIPPGGTFSINGIVGQRTKDKGYVEAPIIGSDYTFDTDVGGGVSQFATTMFNAAFFAGLEIPEYYMHGLYISRYPYGREATLSWPSPDLKVRNQTPYGVLVWPTYTDSSITVTLYSTKVFEKVEQSGQTRDERPAKPPSDGKGTPGDPATIGPCVFVTTDRTRTYPDGRSVVDRFTGLYAPAEGWSCPSTR